MFSAVYARVICSVSEGTRNEKRMGIPKVSANSMRADFAQEHLDPNEIRAAKAHVVAFFKAICDMQTAGVIQVAGAPVNKQTFCRCEM